MNNSSRIEPPPWGLEGPLAGVAALRLAVLRLSLTPAMFAALITFAGTRALAARLQRLRPQLRHAQAWGIPVAGNLVSNTMIVVVSLTQSVVVAGLSLAWLVGIHKLEYFLNAHIIGQRIRAQVWELLLAMLALEAMFGLAGLVRAPVFHAQLKQSLRQRGCL